MSRANIEGRAFANINEPQVANLRGREIVEFAAPKQAGVFCRTRQLQSVVAHRLPLKRIWLKGSDIRGA